MPKSLSLLIAIFSAITAENGAAENFEHRIYKVKQAWGVLSYIKRFQNIYQQQLYKNFFQFKNTSTNFSERQYKLKLFRSAQQYTSLQHF